MAIAGAISLNWVLLLAIAVSLFSGCAKLNDAINQVQKKDMAQGARAPNVADTKAIAQEGFSRREEPIPVENPINPNLVNSPMLPAMKRNAPTRQKEWIYGFRLPKLQVRPSSAWRVS